jgi:membrane protease YdiL (CAAX protease family)
MQRINSFILNLPFLSSLLVLTAILLVIRIFCRFIFEYCLEGYDIIFFETPQEQLSTQPFYLAVLQVSIIGPIIETFIFQGIIYHVLVMFNCFAKNKWGILIIGSLLFGMVHFFSLSYIIVMSITGAFFMYSYIIRYGKHAYWTTVCLHSLINLYALLL